MLKQEKLCVGSKRVWELCTFWAIFLQMKCSKKKVYEKKRDSVSPDGEVEQLGACPVEGKGLCDSSFRENIPLYL